MKATDDVDATGVGGALTTDAGSADLIATGADDAIGTSLKGSSTGAHGNVGATTFVSFASLITGLPLASPDIHVARCITASAKTGDGIDAIRSAIADVLNATDDHGAQHAIALMAEHRQALDNALKSITRAADMAARCDESLEDADLVALEMRTAAEALGQLVGMDQTEEMLGRIFSRFCVGK